MNEAAVHDFFKKLRVKAALSHYEVGKRTVWYATIGEDRLPALLFIPGGVASMMRYKNFYTDQELRSRFTLYAVDRPGFGLSDGAKPAISIHKQAEAIAPLATRIHRVHQPLIVVADDYGAGVAARLVMDFPGLVQGMVLIAGIVAPGSERRFGLSGIAATSYFKNFFSSAYKSRIAERPAQEKNLKSMLPLWKKLNIPVYSIQSKNDWRIRSHPYFLQAHMQPGLVEAVTVPGLRHHILNSAQVEIRKLILALYRRLD